MRFSHACCFMLSLFVTFSIDRVQSDGSTSDSSSGDDVTISCDNSAGIVVEIAVGVFKDCTEVSSNEVAYCSLVDLTQGIEVYKVCQNECPALSGCGSSSPAPSASPVPSSQPSLSPSANPSLLPSQIPSATPSLQPSYRPSSNPSGFPSSIPSVSPTTAPSRAPTRPPIQFPTLSPVVAPSPMGSIGTIFPRLPATRWTQSPSLSPTKGPTAQPTITPSAWPTPDPTNVPTALPSAEPTITPSAWPTPEPTKIPTASPSVEPTSAPSAWPTPEPTRAPTTASPSDSPTGGPSVQPMPPSASPSELFITLLPTKVPSVTPSLGPSSSPVASSLSPTLKVTKYPPPSSVPTRSHMATSTATPDDDLPIRTPEPTMEVFSTRPSQQPPQSPSGAPTPRKSLSNAPSLFNATSEAPSPLPSSQQEDEVGSKRSNFPSFSPSPEPSRPSSGPSEAPSSQPSALDVLGLSTTTSSKYPSTSPSSVPSMETTKVSSQKPTSVTIAPSFTQPEPELNGEEGQDPLYTFRRTDLLLQFRGASNRLSSADILIWENILENWITGFYQRTGERFLRQSFSKIQTDIKVTEQKFGKDDGTSVLEIIFAQQVAVLKDLEELSPSEIIYAPYRDTQANEELAMSLKAGLYVLKDIETPIGAPGTMSSFRFDGDESPLPLTEKTSETPSPSPDYHDSILLEGLELSVRGAKLVSNPYLHEFEDTLEDWFNTFYGTEQTCTNQRSLAIRSSRSIATEIQIIRQAHYYDVDGTPINTFTYNQLIKFGSLAPRKLSACSDGTHMDSLTVEEIATLPFADEDANAELVVALQENISGLADIEYPIPSPIFGDEAESSTAGASDRSTGEEFGVDADDDLSLVIIVAIVAAIALLGGVLICFMVHRRANHDFPQTSPRECGTDLAGKCRC